MFENALGVRKNIEKAIDYYKSSAEKKNFNSAVQLGVLYNEGKEVEKDIDKATEWFVKAADCGLF
jgi:TPR repeat protein